MKQTFRRRDLLRAGLALGAATALPQARACEYFAAHLRITHPWTRAAADGARSAVLCMKFDEVTRADRLIAVETPVAAGAEMGGLLRGPKVDFPIPAGQESLLSEAGTFVRLVGLAAPLQVGRSYPLTLVFERSGVIEASLNVDYTRFL